MIWIYIISIAILLIIYQICSYLIYKDLKKNSIDSSLSVYGPGPDILYKYFMYNKHKHKNRTLGSKFFIAISAFVFAIALIIYAIFFATN